MTTNLGKRLVMIGTGLDTPGGMTAVIKLYRDSGFFEKWQVHYLSSYERPGLFSQLTAVSKVMLSLLWMMLLGSVSLVHVHSASRGSFWRKSLFCALARAFQIPYVFHIHSGEFPIFYRDECGPLAKKWIVKTLGMANKVVALTLAWKLALEEISPTSDVLILGNPVVVGHHLPAISKMQNNILFLGRLRRKKGVFDLIHAIPAILAEFPDSKFTIAGDGDIAGVTKLANQLGVADSVKLPGWVDGRAKDALMESADLLVLPSYFEGLPICILEAMASGIPVISTTVGGIPEVLENGTSGILLEPGDVPALSAAVIKLMLDRPVREKIRSSAFVRVQNLYSVHAIISSLTSIYFSVLSQRNKS